MAANNLLDQHLIHSEYEVYDKFQMAEVAEPLIALLESNGILYELEQPGSLTDTLLVETPLTFAPKLILKLSPESFQQVDQLVDQEMQNLIQSGEIDLPEHFLTAYATDELWEVLRKPEDWNFDTRAIARYLLRSKGLDPSPEGIKAWQEARLHKLTTPQKVSKLEMILLLLFCLLGFLPQIGVGLYISFGWLAMGFHQWQGVLSDPIAGRFFAFDPATRNRAMQLLILGLIIRIASIWWFWEKTTWIHAAFSAGK
jgi:hypothetical protein